MAADNPALIIDGKFTYAGLFCGICFIIGGVFTVLSPLWAQIQSRRSKNRGDPEKVDAVRKGPDDVQGTGAGDTFGPKEPVIPYEAPTLSENQGVRLDS